MFICLSWFCTMDACDMNMAHNPERHSVRSERSDYNKKLERQTETDLEISHKIV